MSRRALILLGILLLVAGIAIGRFGLRDVRIKERTVDHVVYRDRVVEKVVTVEAKAKRDDRHLVKTIVEDRTPAGAVHTETRVEYRDRIVEVAARATHAERTAETQVDRTTTRETITTPLPRWSVGVGVGLDVFKLSPVYQADVAYRLVGPLSVASWVQVRQVDLAPTVGVGARLAF